MSKAVKSAVKVFVITLAVATGAAFLLAGTSLDLFHHLVCYMIGSGCPRHDTHAFYVLEPG